MSTTKERRACMYKNRSNNGLNNICGSKIKEIRKSLYPKTSPRMLANKLQIIESGQRFVTDIELKVIAKVLSTDYSQLLEND